MMSVKVLILCFVVLAMVTGTARAANPVVVVETNMGNFEIELFEDKHYDGTIFHRVIPTFMIQGGGFEPGMKEKKTNDPIKNESNNGLSNLKGTIAMARLGRDVGNVKAADSATAQWFINVKDNTFLDKAKAQDGAGYCVFGRVIKGLDVVEKIKDVETDTIKGHDDVPKKDVIIKSVKVLKQDKK